MIATREPSLLAKARVNNSGLTSTNFKFLGFLAISLIVASTALTPSLISIRLLAARMLRIRPWSATELDITIVEPSLSSSIDFISLE